MIKVDIPAGASLDHLAVGGDGDVIVWPDDKVSLSLGLYDKLDQSSVVKVDSGRQVTLNAKKATPEWWPKLTKGPKPGNVKVDWASWKDEDEDLGEDGVDGGAETDKYAKKGLNMDDDFDFGSMGAGGEGADDEMPPADDDASKKWADMDDADGGPDEAKIEELPDAPDDA